MLTLQASGVYDSELDTPEHDGLTAHCDALFSKDIFDISVTQVEAAVKPDGLTNDVGWKSVAFVGIHPPILVQFGDLTCQNHRKG